MSRGNSKDLIVGIIAGLQKIPKKMIGKLMWINLSKKTLISMERKPVLTSNMVNLNSKPIRSKSHRVKLLKRVPVNKAARRKIVLTKKVKE